MKPSKEVDKILRQGAQRNMGQLDPQTPRLGLHTKAASSSRDNQIGIESDDDDDDHDDESRENKEGDHDEPNSQKSAEKNVHQRSADDDEIKESPLKKLKWDN